MKNLTTVLIVTVAIVVSVTLALAVLQNAQVQARNCPLPTGDQLSITGVFQSHTHSEHANTQCPSGIIDNPGAEHANK